MLFNPHSQIQEEPNPRNSHSSLNQHYLTPNYHHSSRQDDWHHTLETNKSSQGSPSINTSGVCSYDIYGNELSLEDEHFNNMLDQKEMDLECIQEEEATSPDAVTVNQENNDPVTHMITPLKKRQVERPSERRASFALNRSPLIDITPVSKRKCSHHLESKIEVKNFLRIYINQNLKRSFLTPRDDNKHGTNDVMKLR